MTDYKPDVSTWDRMQTQRKVSSTRTRKRYQKPEVKDEGDRWTFRYWMDVILPRGTAPRPKDRMLPSGEILRAVYKWEVLSKQDYPKKKAAQEAVDAIVREVNRSDYKPQIIETFAGFAKRWDETILIHHKPSDQSSTRSIIKVHLLPAFGEWKIRDITAEALQAWVSSRTAEPKTIRNWVTTLKSMWNQVKAWNYADHDPFEGLKTPTVIKGGMYCFSLEETVAIINEAQGWHRLFFCILAETAMRPGELAGLKRTNVTPAKIIVDQSVWRGELQTPKTKNSVRDFVVSPELYEEICAWMEESGPNDHGLVFVTDKERLRANKSARLVRPNANAGKPLSMDSFRQMVLDPILDKLGIRAKIKAAGVRGGAYSFRHMNMTELHRHGVPLRTIQARAGHAPGSPVTFEHYIESVDAEDVKAARIIRSLIMPKQEGETVQ